MLILKANINEQYYFPSQPEIQKNTRSYQEYKPNNKHIALFYQFETDREELSSISLIPDGCLDTVFCCSPTQPDAFLWTSPLIRCKKPYLNKGCIYFGVRFFPEQGIMKLGVSMKELLNQQIPLMNILVTDFYIIEKMATASSFKHRIQLFLHFLMQSQFDTGKEQKMIEYAIKLMYASKGSINIGQLSNTLHYSEQYFRRKFEEYIGFSPKKFCQVIKFQNSLDRFLESDEKLLDVCIDNGYYDQAHFIKDFKKFLHLTPKQYKHAISPEK